MPIWKKDPNDVGVWTFKWDGTASDGSKYLASGETISTYTVTVPGGITKVSDSKANSDTWIAVKLSGGTAETNYDITCQIVTSASNTWETTKTMQVRERTS